MGKNDLEYLEDERKKLWYKVNTVETELNKRIDEEIVKKATDYSNEAKQASKKTSEFKNKSEESKNSILEYLEEVTNKVTEISDAANHIEGLKQNVNQYIAESSKNSTLSKQLYDEMEVRKASLEDTIEGLEKLFDEYDSYEEKVEKLDGLFILGDDNSAKIETLYKSLLLRKKEIDQIYFDIFGYTEKDASGVETKVEGLKDILEKSYKEVTVNVKNLEEMVSGLQTDAKISYDLFIETNKAHSEKILNEWNSHYSELSIKIKQLLPNALTAGLSSAYSEKKDAEIAECKELSRTFTNAVWGLVTISLIPFIISSVSYFQGKSLENVLLGMPRLVLAILPLYIPVLWIAYSSNRKMNLSKRLSEEYSHKEVLSKTFEGLSTQINNIDDKKVSSDLRNKLLYNILEVSSENPGKLISDYNKSDHPLMDALDKSVKFATAFEKLHNIPGFSKMAKVMEKKSQTILKEETEKVSKALESLEEEEDE